MNLSRLDVYAALSYIASGGLAVTVTALGDLLPHETKVILDVSAIVVGVAGLLTRLWKNPTPTQAVQVPTESGETVTIKTVATPQTKAPGL